MITEGFSGTVPRFIHEVRRRNPEVKVFHFCLDTYPSMDVILRLDVDGFLTNSWKLLPELVSLEIFNAMIKCIAADIVEGAMVPCKTISVTNLFPLTG